MYDEEMAYAIVHDMADVMQGFIDNIIDMVLTDGEYSPEVVQVLCKYIKKRNVYLS